MIKPLAPYGSADYVANIAKVGSTKSPLSLRERAPSREIIAKVGTSKQLPIDRKHRVIRRNAVG